MDTNALVAELRAAVQSVWPEVANSSCGVWSQRQIRSVDWGAIALPHAVIVLGDEEPADWAADSLTVEFEVWLYLVVRSQGDAAALRSRLAAMQAFLWPAGGAEPFASAQLLDEAPAAASRDDDPVDEALRMKKIAAAAGAVRFRVLTGISP